MIKRWLTSVNLRFISSTRHAVVLWRLLFLEWGLVGLPFDLSSSPRQSPILMTLHCGSEVSSPHTIPPRFSRWEWWDHSSRRFRFIFQSVRRRISTMQIEQSRDRGPSSQGTERICFYQKPWLQIIRCFAAAFNGEANPCILFHEKRWVHVKFGWGMCSQHAC